MPAEYDEYYSAFADLTGTAGEESSYRGHGIADADHWIDLFEETGIDFEEHDMQIDAFENFLIAFYPTENTTADEWYYARQEFYDMYGIDEHNIDWEDYREAIGYGSS